MNDNTTELPRLTVHSDAYFEAQEDLQNAEFRGLQDAFQAELDATGAFADDDGDLAGELALALTAGEWWSATAAGFESESLRREYTALVRSVEDEVRSRVTVIDSAGDRRCTAIATYDPDEMCSGQRGDRVDSVRCTSYSGHLADSVDHHFGSDNFPGLRSFMLSEDRP